MVAYEEGVANAVGHIGRDAPRYALAGDVVHRPRQCGGTMTMHLAGAEREAVGRLRGLRQDVLAAHQIEPYAHEGAVDVARHSLRRTGRQRRILGGGKQDVLNASAAQPIGG